MSNQISRRTAMKGITALGLAGLLGCESSENINREREKRESKERSNYHLTREINQMLVFNHNAQYNHRMTYREFSEVTGIEKILPAEYDNLPVRVDLTQIDSVKQELDKDESGKKDLVHVYVSANNASDVHAKLTKYYEK